MQPGIWFDDTKVPCYYAGNTKEVIVIYKKDDNFNNHDSVKIPRTSVFITPAGYFNP